MEGEDGQERRRSFDIGRDSDALRGLVQKIGGARLIIVDPISAYVGQADSHKTSDVRAAMAPIQALASEIGAYVVIISHLNKGTQDAAAILSSSKVRCQVPWVNS